MFETTFESQKSVVAFGFPACKAIENYFFFDDFISWTAFSSLQYFARAK